jgi:hypothetical protein
MNCTKSLGMGRAFLETLTLDQQEAFSHGTEAARQGTTAHAAAEVSLRYVMGAATREEFETTLLELTVMPETGEQYTEEMNEAVTLHVDLISQFISERGINSVIVEAGVEAVIPLTGLHDEETYEVRGSADAVVLPVKHGQPLVVADYKHGWMWVDVEENPQIRIYGIGALGLLDTEDLPEEVHYYIVQPNSGGIKHWSESVTDLLDWRDEVLAPALTAALYDDDPMNPAVFAPSEEACVFCPARGNCAALAKQVQDNTAEMFKVINDAEFEDGPGAFPETGTLDDATLGRLLKQAMELESIRKDLKAEAERRLFRGRSLPGFKLVSYTPRREWTADAEEELRDGFPQFFQEKMITPTQALASLSKVQAGEIEGKFVVAPPKRPMIADENDRRKSWVDESANAMFDDLPNE